jgi:hypothetical protein
LFVAARALLDPLDPLDPLEPLDPLDPRSANSLLYLEKRGKTSDSWVLSKAK